MAKDAKKKEGNRKHKYTDEEMATIEELAGLNCHTRTIALAIGVDEGTLRKDETISALIHKKRADYRIGLRRAQYEKGIEGNKDTAMLIFLGKNDLGQVDKKELEIDAGKTLADIAAKFSAAHANG